MQTVNIHAAKTHFSKSVDEVAAGAKIVIARAGKPVARLVPLVALPPAQKRVLGRLAGMVSVPADFDAPLPKDLLDAFEGH